MPLVVNTAFIVPESSADVDTNIDVQDGDYIIVNAWGQIWAGVWLTGANGPRGWNNISNDPKFPLVGSHPYALIGKLDNTYFYMATV